MSRAQRQNYLDEIASWNQHHFHETATQMQPDLEKIERNIHSVTKITADKLQQDLQEFSSKIQGQLDKMVFKMMCSPPERQETILHNLTREHENILSCLADLVTRVQHNLEKKAAKVQSGLDNVVPWVHSDPNETPAWCEHDQEVLKMYIQQDLEVPTDQLHLQVCSDTEMSTAQTQNYVNENASWNQHHFHETATQMQPDLEKIERNIHNVTKITAHKLQQDLKEFNSKVQGQLDKMVFKMVCSPPERQETILHNLTREHENILGCLADLVTRVQHNLDETAAKVQSGLDNVVPWVHSDPNETPAWCEHDQEVLKMYIQQNLEVPTDQLHLQVCSDVEMSTAQTQNYVNENASWNQHHFHETATQMQPDLEKIERNIHNVTKITAHKLQQDLKEFNSKVQGELDKMVFKMMCSPPERQETILHNLTREHENILGCLADLVTRVQHNLDKTAAKVQSGLDNVVPWVQSDPKEMPAWCGHDQEVLKMHIREDLEVPTDQLQQHPTEATDHIQKDHQELVAELQFSQTELTQHNLDEEDGQSQLELKTEMDKSTSHTLLDLHVPVDQFEHDQNELSNQIGGNPEFIWDETGEKSQDEDEKLSKTLSESGSNWEEQAAVSESELKTESTTSDWELREESGSHISLDSFEFHKVLGRGAFGKVMLAELKESGKYYAIKTLKKGSILAEENFGDIRTERRVLMLATESPFLAHLYCTFQTEDNLFFVMEYINGGDLCFNIQQHGHFDLASTKFYAAEIICALQFLHRNGVVYRDLKLENTMLDGDGHIKLVDFGISKDNMFGDSRTDSFCGTRHYIAPEIYLGHEYSTPVDWWAFGVLLFQLLTGENPFAGEDLEEVSRSVCRDTPQYPVWINQNTKDFLGKLLEKDPDFRLGTGTCGNIREHPYLESIDWPRMERREVQPPFKPKLESPYDCRNFDEEFLDETPELSQGDSDWSGSIDQSPFLNFSFTHPKFCSSCEN